jgi:hypothetical protein
MKHLDNSNDNAIKASVLASKDSRKEFDSEFRVLEARLNLFAGFSKISHQLGMDVTEIVPFFKKTKIPYN